jgi:hypothetical protein
MRTHGSPVADEADPAPVLLDLSPALHNEKVVAPPTMHRIQHF